MKYPEGKRRTKQNWGVIQASRFPENKKGLPLESSNPFSQKNMSKIIWQECPEV